MTEPTPNPLEVERLFDLLVSLPREEREAALDRQCAGNHALLAEVARLLAMDDTTKAEKVIRDRLDDALGDAANEATHDPLIGAMIDHFRIIEVLGRGGFGIVYLAEQMEPVRRRVALKVLKAGMDTQAVLGRFEAERQSLALMDHPNVASVYDAGTTDRGLPYFVMEHVKGLPITAYCDRERLSIDERVDLFIRVCDAVQHAHHKGVIHRDIKPSNVLVMWDGSRAVPKIIDFGIARAASGDPGSALGLTRQGQLLGTPEYMSPEQASPGQADIDTRTDVYSLGVVLYELLTGALPIDPKEIRGASLEAIGALLRDAPTIAPSRRLRGLPHDGATTVATVARARGTTSRHLGDVLRRDLDWVVMKCLEMRRDRRYDTPSALAQDLRRFLTGEAVLAGPPSAAYQASKFVRRHRAAVSAAVMVAVALVLGLAGTLAMWSRAEANAERARAAEAASNEVAGALIDEFHASVLPLPGSSRVRERLVSLGVAHLERRTGGTLEPMELLLVARGYDRLGDVEGGLRTPHRGDLEAAERLWERARSIRQSVDRVRPNDPLVSIGLAESGVRFGDLRREQHRFDESVAEYRRGLEHLDHLDLDAASEPEVALLRGRVLVALANILGRLDSNDDERARLLAEAERATRQAVASSPTPASRDGHARALQNLGEFEAGVGRSSPRSKEPALAHLAAAVRIYETLYLEDPVDVQRRRDLAGSQMSFGSMLARVGDKERAFELIDEARSHFEFLAQADPSNVEALARLSQVLEEMGRLAPDRAQRESLLRRAVESSRRVLSQRRGVESDIERLSTQHYLLARRVIERGALDEAAALLAQSVEGLVRSAPDPWTEAFISHLVRTLQTWQVCLQRMDEAPLAASTRRTWLDILDRVSSLLESPGAAAAQDVSIVRERASDCRTLIGRMPASE